MWALYRHAAATNRRVVAFTLAELLKNYRAIIKASSENQARVDPILTAEELCQTHTKYSIFIDDIDKANPTDYALEQLFEIANAIDNYCHQVVITTNLRLPQLCAHFDKGDRHMGEAIVRRLIGQAHAIEMF